MLANLMDVFLGFLTSYVLSIFTLLTQQLQSYYNDNFINVSLLKH